MITRNKIANFLIKMPFVYKAVIEQADLSSFRKKPGKKIMIRNAVGLFLIIFSYVIGWPVVIFLGVMSISAREPLFVIVGGPVAYGLSHLVFLAGMYLTGVHYTKIFLRWAVRMAVEKYADKDAILSVIKAKKDYTDN